MNGKARIRQVLHECITCRKAHAQLSSQLMGQLPQHRVVPAPPFSHTGIDFAGPFRLKMHNTRVRTQVKVYVAVFICTIVKAVHLEIVSDLTSKALIAAFSRFTSRRGKPSFIFSDNATNFVGAAKEFAQITSSTEFQNYAVNESITWKRIPPYSPHFGGLWESTVKSFKTHLKKIIGDTMLTYEEFLTIIVKIEGILNSRPLYALDSDSLEAITPGHFILGRSPQTIPEVSVLEEKINYIDRWKLVQRLTQLFWKQWHLNYLHTLQARQKWKTPQRNFSNGDLVLVKETLSLPYKWVLGKITKTYAGTDNIIRVVDIQTSHGVIKRPITKVAYLASV